MSTPEPDSKWQMRNLLDIFQQDHGAIMVGLLIDSDIKYRGSSVIREELRGFYLQELKKLHQEDKLHGVTISFVRNEGYVIGVAKFAHPGILVSDLVTITPMQYQTIRWIYYRGKHSVQMEELPIYFEGDLLTNDKTRIFSGSYLSTLHRYAYTANDPEMILYRR